MPKWAVMDWWKTVNVLKAHNRHWNGLWVSGINFKTFWPGWSLHLPTHDQLWQRDKWTKWKCVQTILNKSLSKLRNGTHWNQTLYTQLSRHCGYKHLQQVILSWEVCLSLGWTMAEGVNRVTINIVLFHGRTNLYQSMCSEFRYGDGKVLGIQPHLTHRLASTHCIPSLSFVKGVFNMLF